MNDKPKKPHLLLKIVLPLLIIALGVGALSFMGKLKKAPSRQTSRQPGILVDSVKLDVVDHQVRVHAVGTVTADREITLTPQVSGKVDWISPQLVTGGFFSAGETLFKIEADDYRLAVEQANAEVAQAEVALAQEREQARIARNEWERIDLPDKGQPGPLVTREIQLRQQQALLAAAQAGLKKAELNLQRTEIKAPFNGRIREESIDLGQYLVGGTTSGRFAGTDRAEIEVSLPMEELRWLDVPGPGQASGSPALIRLPTAQPAERRGELVRTLGEIDATSRTATAVVAVKDPYGLHSPTAAPILAHGQFVSVVLLGRTLKNVIAVPRAALHTGNVLWLVDADDRLKKNQVDVIRREEDQVIIANDDRLAGTRLVLTNISGAVAGTRLKPVSPESQP